MSDYKDKNCHNNIKEILIHNPDAGVAKPFSFRF